MGVQFLTPAIVTTGSDEGTEDIYVSVDLSNRKVFHDEIEDVDLGKAVFEHIDSATILPDDFFAAPDDVRQKAGKAYEEVQKHKDENLGDTNGW